MVLKVSEIAKINRLFFLGESCVGGQHSYVAY